MNRFARTTNRASFYVPWAVGLLLLTVLAPLGRAQGIADKSYRLRALDQISIQVYGEPDLSKNPRIDGSGQIRMGLIGTVGIAGLTIAEAEDKLENIYMRQRYLRDPQISIEVQQYAALYVHVFGQVRSPGRVQLEEEQLGIPILDLISAAGGFTGLAKSDSVRVTRTNNAGTEQIIVINVEDLIRGKSINVPDEFRELIPGDVVFVPEKLF